MRLSAILFCDRPRGGSERELRRPDTAAASCGGPTPQQAEPQAGAQPRPPQAEEFVTLDGEQFPALAALGPPPIPADNRQTVDANGWPLLDDPKVELGKLLFFDARLSGDNSVSCATCHAPDEGWGLNSTISRGYPGTSHWRNSHTVVNSGYLAKLFWQGDQTSLEVQGKTANTGLSGNGKTDMMEERIRQAPEYVRRFKEVFGTELPLLEDGWRAIAAFQRALNDANTPFDRYMKGDKTALDEQQVRGLALFQGKAQCIRCHNGPLLSDEKFYNTGVPLQPSFLEDPLQQITHRFQYFSKGVTEELYRKGKTDLGLYFNTDRKEDIGKVRIQPLRYTAFTAPYMHNGVFDTLREVIDFYNDGGGEDLTLQHFGIPNKTKVLKKLGLTDEEKEDLLAFMDGLTGDEIKMDTPTLPETAALVYQGETYVGLPIPVVSDDLAARAAAAEAGAVKWTLVEGPPGVAVDSETGRVTWPNAQAPAEGPDVAIKIRSETAGGAAAEQTLRVTVSREPVNTVFRTGASTRLR
ncbi:MAG: cytochrome-c peroxidase [Armatimonadetes bacterium]|nr:cytochrome-c peroxidase [Armatimonadota bacterium]